MPTRLVKARAKPKKDSKRLRMVAKVPTGLQGKPLIVVPSLRSGATRNPDKFPARLFAKAQPTIAISVEYDVNRMQDSAVAQVGLYPLPPAKRRFSTKPILIPKTAELTVSLAVAPFAEALDAGPTDFVLEARWNGGEKEVLRETLPASAGGAWHDRRIDLSEFADREVHFRFLTTSKPIDGDPNAAAAFPLWGSPEILAQRKRDGRRNILLISLDTVRADFMGGESRGLRLTPWFDQLSDEGTLFRQAISTFSSTSASHMSLFTGTYPATHNVRHAVHQLPSGIATLPEILGRNGYATAAVTENAMLLAGSGFSRGFDSYRENKESLKHTGSIDRTFGQGIEWLEEHRDELFFLFLHTYEAHSPYAPKPEVLAELPEVDAQAEGLGKKDVTWERTKRMYAAEVHYTDSRLEHLFGELRRLELLDHTLVVITADHGEEFGEHGNLGHAKTIFDEVLRVPLLFWAPGHVPEGRVNDDLVSLIDVPPTIMELARIPPPPGIPGRSLVATMHGDPPSGTGVRFAEGLEKKVRMVAARTPTHKWIWRDDGSPILIYDLRTDPGENNPLDDPALLAEGQALIDAYLSQDDDQAATEATKAVGNLRGARGRVLDQSTRQKLEALGYAE